MARPIHVDMKLVAIAQRTVKATRHLDDFRSALAVLLPAQTGLTLQQTAKVLGIGTASIHRRQTRLRLGLTVTSGKRNWGGRRQALLTPQEEVAFLQPWAEQAQPAGLLVLSPIRAALAQRIGQPVKASVVWRLLARHGWRKVAPDTRHPKNDPQIMQAWKKTPENAGRPAPKEQRARPQDSLDVPGRGALWPAGEAAPRLGTETVPARQAQRIRARVCLRVWGRPPARRRPGLGTVCANEHAAQERIPRASEPAPP